ncbi:DUF1127 domain-containing protein [Acidocella aquatica]|nr:DUF1127 domain-containing protein [Acidocella aquatica]
MTTTIKNHYSFGKFGELLFARQRPYVAANRHKSLLDGYKAWRKRREAEAELESLSDRELSDIGLSRATIHEAVKGF